MKLQFAAATYKLEIMVHSFFNPGRLESNGNRCDIHNNCDNRFTFCLRPSTESRSTNKSVCTLGQHQTGIFSSDNINFAGLTDLGNSVSNPMVFSGETWPVSYLT